MSLALCPGCTRTPDKVPLCNMNWLHHLTLSSFLLSVGELFYVKSKIVNILGLFTTITSPSQRLSFAIVI